MALNLNREISFGGKKGRKGKSKSAYPEKTYMNLMPVAAKPEHSGRKVLVTILVILLVAAFAKFGVFDFYAKVAEKKAELATETQTLNALQAKMAEYDTVAKEYEGYNVSSLIATDTPVEALDVLRMVDACVSPYAHVDGLTLSGDALLLTLSDTSLDNLGRLSSELEQRPEVKGVSVSTASSKGDSAAGTTASVMVDLQSPDGTTSSAASAGASSKGATTNSSAGKGA